MPYYTATPEALISVNSTGFAVTPALAKLPDGGFVATWVTTPSGSFNQILVAQRFNSAGAANGPLITVSDTGTSKGQPVVSVSPLDGNFTIAWVSGNTDVVSRSYSFNGNPLSIGEPVATQGTTGQQVMPAITHLAGGSYVLTWSDLGRDGSGYGIYGRRFNSDGTPAGDDFQVSSATNNSEVDPEVVALPDGGFGVFWTTAPSSSNIAYQRFNASGQKVGGETIIAGSPTFIETDPDVAVLADGTLIVTWAEFAGAVFVTKVQRFDASGGGLGVATTITGTFNPQIVALPDGGYAITGRSGNEFGPDGTDVFVQRFDAAGQKVGGEWSVTGNVGASEQNAAMTVLNDGSFVVAWESNALGVQPSIRFSRFRDAGDYLTDGADRAMATNRADYIEGYGGNDELHGADGNDVLDGGAGADRLIGGAGEDEATYLSAAAGVTLNLAANIHGGDAAGDTFNSIERFSLSRFGDRFVGGAGADKVSGLSGDDSLVGGGGADVLDGGVGDDILEGGDGGDALIGGEGFDEANFARAGQSVAINLATGVHTGSAQGDTYQSIERFVLTGFNDMFTGSAGQDRVAGGLGDDLLNGGAGADELVGGDGNDRYVVGDAADLVLELAGGGVDSVKASAGYALPDQVETLRLIGTGNSAGTGNELDNLLVGNAGNNALKGGGGNDRILPGAGVNSVEGGAGVDTLVMTGARAEYSFFTLAGVDYLFNRSGGARVSGIEQVEFGNASLGFESLRAGAVAFDGLTYIASHRDLALSLGRDAAAGTAHFVSTGFAQGRNPLLFDGLRYTASHADLISAFGTNRDAARDHYLRNGAPEGRAINSFDPLRYIASHGDLIAGLGTDADAGARHYIQFGFKEGRGVTFDPLRYIASHADLIGSIGTDTDAALRHYIRFGFNEARGAGFDPLRYGATHLDLARDIGLNPEALTRHYIDLGFDEGRATTGFDSVGYLLGHSDLGAAGLGAAGALQHWLRFGALEERAGDALFGRDQLSHGIAVGQTRNDALSSGAERDWFQVTLAAGQKVTIGLASDQFDPFLQLHDASGRLVAFDADSGAGDDALLSFTAAQAGSYYLVVGSSAAPLGGDYALVVTP